MSDVARSAGVSIATVSFVLNDTKPVRPETRRRVERAMRDLGYRRNEVARALASRRTHNIALVFPALEHHLNGTVMQIVAAASRTATALDYRLVLWPISNDATELESYVAGGAVDGVILMEVQLDDARVRLLETLDTPFVLIGRTADPTDLEYIDIDFDATVDGAVDHLRALGHRQIGLVTESTSAGQLEGYGPLERVEAAFRRRMAADGVKPAIERARQSPKSGRAAVARLLTTHETLTAMIVMNEEAASGVESGLRHAGLRVPDDVSMVCLATSDVFDGTGDSDLTVMTAPTLALGRAAMEALIGRIEREPSTLTQVTVPCPLSRGGSTGPAPLRDPKTARARD